MTSIFKDPTDYGTTFIRFMEKKKLLDTFNVHRYNNKGISLNRYLETVAPEDYMLSAFPWSKVLEPDSWEPLHDEWVNIVRG